MCAAPSPATAGYSDPPTIFGATPTFWVGLHQEYLTALNHARKEAPEGLSPEKVEASLLAEWKERSLLGNRCKLIIVGGAATTPGTDTHRARDSSHL